jgi:hypothetical protein
VLSSALGACIETHAVPKCAHGAVVAEQLLPHVLLGMGAWVLGRGGARARAELLAGAAAPASPLAHLQALPLRFYTPGSCGSAALFPVFLACLWDGGSGGGGGGGGAAQPAAEASTEAQLRGLLGSAMPLQPLADFIKAQAREGAAPLPPALGLARRLPAHALDSLLAALDLE